MDMTGHPEGAHDLATFIARTGDDPRSDDEAVQRLREAHVLALGERVEDGSGRALLLRCTVPYAGTTTSMLPVWTRLEHLGQALADNPDWRVLRAFEVAGTVALDNAGPDEWIGINAWTRHEFKLPQAALRGRPELDAGEDDGGIEAP